MFGRKSTKPLIVGLQHQGFSGADIPKLDAEFDRARKLINETPKGTRIGVEITPKKLAELKFDLARYGVQPLSDVLDRIVQYSILNGNPIVPLDSESRFERHGRAIERRYGTKVRGIELHLGMLLEATRSTLRQEMTRGEKEDLAHSSLRSKYVGQEVVKEKLRLSFMGDGHARDISFIFSRAFRYDFSSKQQKPKAQEKQSAAFRTKILKKLKQKVKRQNPSRGNFLKRLGFRKS